MEKTIKIEVLGAGLEVGRNCFKLTYPTGEKILLDCGMKVGNGYSHIEDIYPLNIKKLSDVNLSIVSHGHIDHIGGFPLAFILGLRSPIIIADEITREVSKVLLEDALKFGSITSKEKEHFSGWINYVIANMKIKKSGRYGKVSYELLPSNHIPGGVSILLKHPQTKSLFYTGDIKMSESLLMSKRTVLHQAEVAIVESTYGDMDQPRRKKTEAEFEKIVLQSLKKGGQVLIPCFSVGRAPEILLQLEKFRAKLGVKVYLDGMARKVTQIYLKYLKLLDNPELVKAIGHIKFVVSREERQELLNKQAVIVASGGMVNSPLVHFYLKKIARDENNSLILTGFQTEGTGGHELITQGTITFNKGRVDQYTIKPKCGVYHLNFSAHGDKKEIAKVIKTICPETVIAIHGQKAGINGVQKISQRLKITCIAPKNGETILV